MIAQVDLALANYLGNHHSVGVVSTVESLLSPFGSTTGDKESTKHLITATSKHLIGTTNNCTSANEVP